MKRISPARAVLYLLIALGIAAGLYRLYAGIGAISGVNDEFPWGIWKGIQVFTGIPMAAAGFTMAFVVYVLNLERYRPLMRMSILVGLIGYFLSGTSVFIDLGLPQRFWHPVVYWNLHSPLFEVAVCVILYLSILFLEFSPVYFEGTGKVKAAKVMKALTVPLVIAGIVLSTMHQSSLGSIYLIAPGRLHPLWFTTLLPLNFFISAVAAGLAMVGVVAYLTSRVYRRTLELPLLTSLGKGAWWVLLLYLVVRLGDMALKGNLGYAFAGTLESNLFLVEALLLLAAFVLLALPGVRSQATPLFAAQSLLVLGVAMNRFNTSMVGMARALGGSYVPAWGEVAVTVGMIAFGIWVFAVAVERLPVFAEGPLLKRGEAEVEAGAGAVQVAGKPRAAGAAGR